MADAPPPGGDLSGSVRAALGWAGAVARIRTGRLTGAGSSGSGSLDPDARPTTAMDLFLGALLAHGDEDGEVRVLLTHLGLTARDVTGTDYPEITPATLVAASRAEADPPWGPQVEAVLGWAQARSPRVQLLHVVGGLLVVPSPLRVRLEDVFARAGESIEVITSSFERWLDSDPLSSFEPAGSNLREWLRTHNPRSVVNIAGFASDEAGDQADLIGITAEADALAYLIASRDLVPPLAVGLFGDWGSGKSFLMRSVEQRVSQLGEQALALEQHDASVWRQIRSIRFNAWEYVQGDLWAGLLERIFSELGDKAPATNLVQDRLQPLQAELAEQTAAITEAEGEAARQQQEREEAQQDVTAAEDQLRSAKESFATAGLDEDARVAAEVVLTDLWGSERGGTARDVDELLGALTEARGELQRGRALLGPYWRSWRHVVLITLAALVVPLTAFVLQRFGEAPGVTAALGALAAAVPVVTLWLKRFASWTDERLTRVAEAQEKVRSRMAAPVTAAQDELGRARERLAAVETLLAEQQAVVTSRRSQAEALQATMAALTPARVFVEFTDERSSDYRRRLGPLAAVRRDLETLQRSIAENNQLSVLTPEQRAEQRLAEPDADVPNRIVLYIDDLDRCPPTTVLQVLEAVHLLLAFPLFVVLVAVDERWLSSALTDRLTALQPRRWERPVATRLPAAGDPQPEADPGTGLDVEPGTESDLPTPDDYLEKIFQLPFWVQPMDADDRSRLVAGLLGKSVELQPGDGSTEDSVVQLEVGPQQTEAVDAMLALPGTALRLETRALALGTDELAFLTSLGPLLGDTPRRIKRFVNTVQFLLSMSPPLSSDGPRSERMVVCFIAAVHEGLPLVARFLFSPQNHDISVGALLQRLSGSATGAGEKTEGEAARLREWLAETEHAQWSDVRAAQVMSRLEMIERTSFRRPPA